MYTCIFSYCAFIMYSFHCFSLNNLIWFCGRMPLRGKTMRYRADSFCSKRQRNRKRRPGFLTGRQANPAILSLTSRLAGVTIDVLLLRSGIEPNPGPSYPCAICNQECLTSQHSFWCHFGGWVHVKCAEVPRGTRWSRKFECRKCHYCMKAKHHFNDFNRTKNFKKNTFVVFYQTQGF